MENSVDTKRRKRRRLAVRRSVVCVVHLVRSGRKHRQDLRGDLWLSTRGRLALEHRASRARYGPRAVDRSQMLTVSHRRRSSAATLPILLLAGIGLAACGGSAGDSQRNAASAGAASTTAGGQAASRPTIPIRGKHLSNPAFRQTLTKFAVCLQKHGVTVPTPKTSGGGPVLNIKAINTSSAQFKAAWAKCRSNSDLGRAFHKPEPGGGRPGSGALRSANRGVPEVTAK
jgi:hypothetical protein